MFVTNINYQANSDYLIYHDTHSSITSKMLTNIDAWEALRLSQACTLEACLTIDAREALRLSQARTLEA